MNRRDFLRRLGIGLAGAAIAPSILKLLPAEPVNLSVPITWTATDLQMDKVALIKQLLENGIRAHDELLERAIFTSGVTHDFRGLPGWVEGTDRAA